MSKSLCLGLLLGVAGICHAEPNRPNIVIVLADDLGYGDLACYGHKVIQSPHLDRFAKQGLRLTSCYSAAPNCSPSRAGLMSGRTPTRVGIHNWIPFLSPMHLKKEEITIATLLKKAGYDTCHVGKWHLNGRFNLPGQPQPGDHGFDHWFSTQNNALPNHRNPYNFVRNGIPVGPLKGYSAGLVADEAINWLTKRKKESPFFLFVCFHEPHEPIASAPKYAKMYPFKDPSRVAHHANVTQMDAAFGRLMKTLDDLKQSSNTLVVFTSDNGPAITSIHPHGSSGPLRAKKGFVYEGGIRVPGIIRWPGKVKANHVSDEPVCGVDFLPTLCKAIGIDAPKDRILDGASILPIFEGKKVKRTTPLYWHFFAARGEPKVAMRHGDWKILATLNLKSPRPTAHIVEEHQKAIKTAKLARFELYNLRKDIGEKNDLASTEKERLTSMIAMLQKKYREVQKESPTWPKWTWPRYEGKRIEWPEYRKKRK